MPTDLQAIIRTATPADAGTGRAVAVAAGMFTANDAGVVDDLLERHFTSPSDSGFCVVAENAATIVGIAYAEANPAADRLWYLTMIGVVPTVARSGIGTALLSEIEDQLRGRGQRLLLVETSALPEYEPARRFYLRLGYDEEARVRDFHEDGDDMVLFRKRLS